MRALIQRVTQAVLSIDKKPKVEIANGVVVFLGIETMDVEKDAEYLCKKIAHLRIFDDDYGKPNLSLLDTNGQLLLVSQFTLLADTRKGNRPSYIKAARPEMAITLYNKCINELEKLLKKQIQTGVFGADMEVALTNSGPFTIWLDSKEQ